VGLHYHPLDMVGQTKSLEFDQESCRVRCTAVQGCEVYSYWSDGGCHLQDLSSQLVLTDPPSPSSVCGPVLTCSSVTHLMLPS
jgi:hypothetical protein